MWDGVASSCTANMQFSALDMGNAILFYPIHLSKDDVAEGTACNYEVDVSELAHCMEYGMTAPTHVQFSLSCLVLTLVCRRAGGLTREGAFTADMRRFEGMTMRSHSSSFPFTYAIHEGRHRVD